MPRNAPHDPAVVAWLEQQPRQLTYSELAAACEERFPASGWDADTIRDYFLARRRPSRSPIDRDPELLAFLLDRIGRLTGDEILAQCREAFAPERVPSRSATYRMIEREMQRHMTRNAIP